MTGMKKRRLLGMTLTAACLAAALVLAGCGGTSSPADPPPPITGPALNGTWDRQLGWQIWTFNNGSFVVYYTAKGTFSTSGDTLTLNVTHQHGTILVSWGYADFEGREWVPRAELIAGDNNRFDEDWFAPDTWTYKVAGDTLTLTHAVDGRTWTFTRQ